MAYKLLIGGYTSRGLRVLTFDPGNEQAKLVAQATAINAGPDPSWIIQYPSDPSLIFITNEIEDGNVTVVKLTVFDTSGEIRGEQTVDVSSGGQYPAHLLILKDSVIIGNYMGGSILDVPYSTSPLSLTDTSKEKKEGIFIKFSGTGPNADRQESSHPHEVYLHRDELLIPDLGADKVWRLERGASGWEVKGAIAYPAGSGPRHILIHNDILYTVLELSNELAVHKFAPLPEVPTLIAKLSTFVVGSPPDLAMLAAEILLSPNKQLVYVSNRNDPSEEGDTIAVYSVATATKEPKLVREIRTGVTHARGMEFSKDGNYLAVVGNRTNSIRIFSVVEGSEDGEVKFVAGYTGLDKPTTLVWL